MVSYWLVWYRNKFQQFWFIHKCMQSNIKRNDVCMNAPNMQLNINSSTCWTLNEQLHRKLLLSIFHFWWFHKISVSWVIYELKSKKKKCPVQHHKKWGVYSKTVKEDPESLDWVVQNTLTGSLVDTSNTWFTYEWSYLWKTVFFLSGGN